MSRCFECGGKTAADRLTAVGDAVFCEKCFAQLLTKAQGTVAEGTAAQAEPVAQRSGISSTSSAAPRRAGRNACLVCEKPMLAGEPAMAFPGGHICRNCASDMAAELAEAPEEPKSALVPSETNATRREVSAPSDEAAARAVANTSAVADTVAAPTSVSTPGSATAQCAGCDRLMPGPGSYRLIEGKPYCAACVPFYSVYHAQKSVQRAPAQAAPRSDPDGPALCDCCSAALGTSMVEHGGFRICSACQATDVALATAVARARHRHRLQDLGKRLGVDEEKP